MQLSVCMIVKNEEENIQKALNSIIDVADEIVVVDTGSNDCTVKIAKEVGAKVFHFQWIDDFSAARNEAIQKAEGKWIFWIDADEELLVESKKLLKEAIRDKSTLGYYVLRRDLIDKTKHDLYTEMWQLRLFQNIPDLKFKGRCHPHFSPSEHEIAESLGLKIKHSKIILKHYGYTPNLRNIKLERAARLLKLELEERPGQLYYMIEYGRTLHKLRDPQAFEILSNAAKIVIKYKNENKPPTPMVAALFEYLLQIPENKLPAGFTRKILEELCEHWFPKGAPLLWLRAKYKFIQQEYTEAENLLRRLIYMGETQDYDRHISFDPCIIGDDAKLNLGVCLVRQAKLKEAKAIFKKLLKSSRKKEAKANLKVIKEIIQHYGSF